MFKWNRVCKTLSALTLTAGLVGTMPGEAAGATLDDVLVEYWVGEGANRSYLVVDFAATSDRSFTFGLRWDEPVQGHDLLDAIITNGTLEADLVNFGSTDSPSYFVDNIWYLDHAGDVNQYWAQWDGQWSDTLGTVQWTLGDGLSTFDLTDGLFVGLHNPWSATDAPRVSLVPEPGSVLLLTGGTAMLLLRRRRRHIA